MRAILRTGLLILAATLTACGGKDPEPPDAGAARPTPAPRQPDAVAQPQPAAPPPPLPAIVFWQHIQALCGDAYAGGLTVGTEESDRDIGYAELTMHVRYCDDAEIRIPFHVDDDRSRTWVLTLDDHTITLNHIHRHEDGSEDAVTNYGGSQRTPGTAARLEFPVGADTVGRLPATEGNVWAIEIEPGDKFAYELQRERDMRFFRVEFDLRETVATPPPPWGAQ